MEQKVARRAPWKVFAGGRGLLLGVVALACVMGSCSADAPEFGALQPLCPNSTQAEALSDLYRATGGPSWKTSKNWLQGNYCSWFGVECDGRDVTLMCAPLALREALAATDRCSQLSAGKQPQGPPAGLHGRIPRTDGARSLRQLSQRQVAAQPWVPQQPHLLVRYFLTGNPRRS